MGVKGKKLTLGKNCSSVKKNPAGQILSDSVVVQRSPTETKTLSRLESIEIEIRLRS